MALAPGGPIEVGEGFAVAAAQFRDSGREFVVVSIEPGHQPASERSLLAKMEVLHKRRPLEWMYALCDPQHIYIEMPLKEMTFGPYRAFPDAGITRDVVNFLIDSGTSSAAFGFGIVSEPPVRMQLFDDWMGWAQSREALRRLDIESARIMLALMLTVDSGGSGGGGTAGLARLLNMSLTWEEHQSLLPSASDIGELVGAEVSRPAIDRAVVDFLTTAATVADGFYRAMDRRARALTSGAIAHAKDAQVHRAALLVDAPFAAIVITALREAEVGFVHVVPSEIPSLSMLDLAGAMLGNRHRNIKLQQAFSGQSVRSDVENLRAEEDNINQSSAQDWASAAQRYVYDYEGTRHHEDHELGKSCVDNALRLAPALPYALWIAGELHQLDGEPGQALALFDRCVAADSHSEVYRRARALALHRLGRRREAYRNYLLSIYIAPKNGDLWSYLGLACHERGRRRMAGFCFKRGKELGDEIAAHNLDIVSWNATPRWFHGTPLLSRPVVWFMHRWALPVYYGWGNTRAGSVAMASIVALVGLLVHGGSSGYRASGFGGAAVGAVIAVVSGVLLLTALFLTLAIRENKRGSRRWHIGHLALALLGAIAGMRIGEAVSSMPWEPLGRFMGGLVGLAAGLALPLIGVIAGLLIAWARRSGRST